MTIRLAALQWRSASINYREFVNAEKTKLGPSANWILNLAPIPPIRGQVEPLLAMFRQFVRNAVESFPRWRGNDHHLYADGPTQLAGRRNSAMTAVE